MGSELPILLLLMGTVAYLFYKVRRLEQMIGSSSRDRRRPVRSARGSKIIPILKDQIEPGPFKPGKRWGKQAPQEGEEQ